MQLKPFSTFLNLRAPHPGVTWETSFIHQLKVQLNPCSITKKPENIKLRFQKQEDPILTVNLIIHYKKHPKIPRRPGFHLIWAIATEILWHSVSTFGSDKNFQFVLGKFLKIIDLERSGMEHNTWQHQFLITQKDLVFPNQTWLGPKTQKSKGKMMRE